MDKNLHHLRSPQMVSALCSLGGAAVSHLDSGFKSLRVETWIFFFGCGHRGKKIQNDWAEWDRWCLLPRLVFMFRICRCFLLVDSVSILFKLTVWPGPRALRQPVLKTLPAVSQDSPRLLSGPKAV